MFYKLIMVNSGDVSKPASWMLELPATIGRSAEHRVCIVDDSVSRNHCRLSLNGDGALMVRDLNSLNGTYLNDERINQALIMPGDTIHVGAVALRVEIGGELELDEPLKQPLTFDLSATVPMQPALKRPSGENSGESIG